MIGSAEGGGGKDQDQSPPKLYFLMFFIDFGWKTHSPKEKMKIAPIELL